MASPGGGNDGRRGWGCDGKMRLAPDGIWGEIWWRRVSAAFGKAAETPQLKPLGPAFPNGSICADLTD